MRKFGILQPYDAFHYGYLSIPSDNFLRLDAKGLNRIRYRQILSYHVVLIGGGKQEDYNHLNKLLVTRVLRIPQKSFCVQSIPLVPIKIRCGVKAFTL